jgi:hypothetical protein
MSERDIELTTEEERTTEQLAEHQDERLVEYLTLRVDECIMYRESELIPALKDIWELYDSEPTYENKTTPWNDASNLCVALAATYVDQFTAKHVNALRSPTPFISLKCYLPELTEHTRDLEQYLDWCEHNLWKGQQIVEDFERERCKVGTGVGYVGFIDVPYMRRRSITDKAEPAGRVKRPDPKWIPREDVIITPEYDDPDMAPLIGHRSWMSKASLQKLAVESQIDVDFEVIQPTRKEDSDGPAQPEETGLYEIYFLSFAYDLDEDGYPEEYEAVWHHDSKQLLHYDVNKRAFGKRPYFHAPYVRKEGEFDGLGICEQIEQYQAEISTMHNQRIDNATIANNVMLKGRPSNFITERSRWYPGKIWLVNDINDLEPLDLPRSYRSTMDEESMTIGLAERRIGISDAQLGRESTLTNRAAATTMLALMEQGAQRDDLSVTLARDAFQRYGELILEAFQIYGLPDIESSTSPESILGAEHGARVRQLVDREDNVLGLVGVTIDVSTRAINKEMERQANQQLYGMIMNHIVQVTKIMPMALNPQAPPQVQQFFVRALEAAETVLRRVVEDSGTYDLGGMFMGDLLGGQPMGGQLGGSTGPTANGSANSVLGNKGQAFDVPPSGPA